MSSNGGSMIVCKKCGTENKNGDSFCGGCGDSLLQQNIDESLSLPQADSIVVCTKCGTKLQSGDSFCKGCGGSLLENQNAENVSKENGNQKVWFSVAAVAVGILVIASPLIFSDNNPSQEMAPVYEEVAAAAEEVVLASTSEDVFIDTYTNLMWQDNVEAKTLQKNWQESIDYCEDLSLAGFDDWRLPSKEELSPLYRSKESLKNVVNGYYWSSSSGVGTSNYAWDVNFYSGSDDNHYKNDYYFVRCVRDSK